MTDEQLTAAYEAAWHRVRVAYRALEPILEEKVSRAVRRHAPDATKITLEPTDQGGPGWVLHTVYVGRRAVDDDAFRDDDELTMLLDAYGELVSSEDTPAPYDFELTTPEATRQALEAAEQRAPLDQRFEKIRPLVEAVPVSERLPNDVLNEAFTLCRDYRRLATRYPELDLAYVRDWFGQHDLPKP